MHRVSERIGKEIDEVLKGKHEENFVEAAIVQIQISCDDYDRFDKSISSIIQDWTRVTQEEYAALQRHFSSALYTLDKNAYDGHYRLIRKVPVESLAPVSFSSILKLCVEKEALEKKHKEAELKRRQAAAEKAKATKQETAKKKAAAQEEQDRRRLFELANKFGIADKISLTPK